MNLSQHILSGLKSNVSAISKLQSWTSCRSHFTYFKTRVSGNGNLKKMNMFNAINNAMDLALQEDKTALLFGEDVGFGGVFRASADALPRMPVTFYVMLDSFIRAHRDTTLEKPEGRG